MSKYSLFPYADELSKDSLFHEIKEQFEKKKARNHAQQEIEKLGSKKPFLRFFSLVSIFKILFLLRNEASKAMLLLTLVLPIMLGLLFMLDEVNAINMVLGFSIGFIFMLSALYSYVFSDILASYDNKLSKYTDHYKNLTKIYPVFLNQKLNKDQMSKLKKEIEEYVFISIMNENGSILYKDALNEILREHMRNKTKDEDDLKEIKAEEIRERKRDFYRNLK